MFHAVKCYTRAQPRRPAPLPRSRPPPPRSRPPPPPRSRRTPARARRTRHAPRPSRNWDEFLSQPAAPRDKNSSRFARRRRRTTRNGPCITCTGHFSRIRVETEAARRGRRGGNLEAETSTQTLQPLQSIDSGLATAPLVRAPQRPAPRPARPQTRHRWPPESCAASPSP